MTRQASRFMYSPRSLALGLLATILVSAGCQGAADRSVVVANADPQRWIIRVHAGDQLLGFWEVPSGGMVRLDGIPASRDGLTVVALDDDCRVVTPEPFGAIPTTSAGAVSAAIIEGGDVVSATPDQVLNVRGRAPFMQAPQATSSICM